MASRYRNALIIERLIGGTRLYRLEKVIRVILCALLIVTAVFYIIAKIALFAELLPGVTEAVAPWYGAVTGALKFWFAVWLAAFCFRAFYYSSYFQDLETTLPEPFLRKKPELHYEVALAFSGCNGDILGEFLSSRFGFLALLRLGLTPPEIIGFLKTIASGKTVDISIPTEENKMIGLTEVARQLFNGSEQFQHFLSERSITERDFIGACEWISRSESQYKKALRFFGRDSLGRIRGIGKDWAYGETALLLRYARDITEHPIFISSENSSFGALEEEEMERILARGREANVMLVGEEGVPKLAVLARLARQILAGTILPQLEHKRVFVFEGALFASAMKEKAVFETELTRLLSEVASAGNIIFTFDNFHSFVDGARALGSDVISLIDPFLDSPSIQIVAVTETGAFHQLFEPNPKIRERFEHVQVSGADVEAAIPILEDEALREEFLRDIFFTYQAVRATAQSAEQYFFEGVMPDKAVDLLLELSSKAKDTRGGDKSGRRVITRDDVMSLVSRKTGISLGEAKTNEKEKLLNLEQTLHERIVGQEEAVKAIAGALRRARSGVGNPNRPMGSFLFLGPTGVGKTETTKALAQAFFGDEGRITRFDMSEYQTEDALHRLIGTFESGKAGALASALRERQFGVLLLDEFEKTNKDVHDLFLQILDEGFFTDASGKRVNARNLLIIATSNAGSDLIWDMLKKDGGAGGLAKDTVINEIINRGIFKPELLNRFDGVILFHPLGTDHLRKIARFMLQKLAKRLKEKGIELVITEALVENLVSVGQDPKFGARPMNRAIQERVEQMIAEKMLRGEIGAGSRVELTDTDLKQEEVG